MFITLSQNRRNIFKSPRVSPVYFAKQCNTHMCKSFSPHFPWTLLANANFRGSSSRLFLLKTRLLTLSMQIADRVIKIVDYFHGYAGKNTSLEKCLQRDL